ncbi:MAG: type VI secretion system tube protein TssD [Planctomycetota bacterium]
MNRTARLVTVATLGVAGIGIAVASQLGPLNPPEGAVRDTGPALNDLAAIPPVATPTAGRVALFLTSNASGEIRGSNADGSIDIFEVDFLGVSPRDASTGLPTGRRTYEPIRIRKRIDASSPLLADSFSKNATVEGALLFFRTDGQGNEQHYYTIELTEATIASIRTTTTTLRPGRFTHDDVIEILPRVIRWIDVDSGVEATDDWVTPRAINE